MCMYIYLYAILLFEYFVVHRVSEPYFYQFFFFFFFGGGGGGGPFVGF